jgi:hypothetical protein
MLAVARARFVSVDLEVCKRVAHLLASKPIPPDEEDSSLAGFSRLEVGNFYLLVVAICHQTSPRGRPPLEGIVDGTYRRGWDYLTAKMEAAVRADRSRLDPRQWATMSVADFMILFRDPQLGDRLSDPERRVNLVQNLGRVMCSSRWHWAEDMYKLCAGRAATSEPNLFGLLARFAAYRDPIRKKSCFFLALMRNSGFWHYVDNDQVGAPVDYHEVRGHLRIGTVTVADPDLRQRLMTGSPVTAAEDIAIRGAVYDAIAVVSDLSGLRNPSQLHYLFWNVFRTHCLREDPHCFEAAPALPERYKHLAMFGDEIRCPFSGVCASACSPTRYYEHVFETDYY